MARNPNRRAALADAGLRVLAEEGPRGLTHRAVDEEAKVPSGTTSNYFRSRDALLGALGARIYERLAPPAEVLANPRAKPPTVSSLLAYMHDIVHRITAQPELWLALLELRLAARRQPGLAAPLNATLHAGYRADVAFHAAAGLPGGAREIALLHYALDGLLLDRLSASIGSDESLDQALAMLVERVVGGARIAPARGAPLFHITTKAAWRAARARGTYQPASLTHEGFVHLSTARQWRASLRRFFRGQRNLILLQVDSTLLTDELRFEAVDGDWFPHLYGPLPVSAVTRVVSLPSA